MIVDQVEGRSRLSFRGIKKNDSGSPELLMPLLWTCHNFRNIVYSRFCSRYSLDLTADARIPTDVWPGWPSGLGWHNRTAYRLVKELKLEVENQSVFSGKALQMLSHGSYRGCLFPDTRFVKLDLSLSSIITSESNDNMANPQYPTVNAYAFVERVKQLAPKADDISLSCHSGSALLGSCPVTSLVSQLHRLAHRIELRDFGPLNSEALQLEAPHTMSRITYDTRNCSERSLHQLVRVVWRSAQTLQYLSIKAPMYTSAPDFTCNDGSGNVLYPRLVSLKLDLQKSRSVAQWPATGDAIFFPALRSLTIDDHYPFCDDTLFRGNAGSLESLHIMPTPKLHEILRRFSVFTPTSHPKLQCVRTKMQFGNKTHGLKSADEIVRFALSIAPDAAVREIGVFEMVDDTFHALDVLKSHTNIHMLILPEMVLPLWFIVSLIKWLPLLSDLHCKAAYSDPLPKNTKPDELLAYTQTLHGLRHERFRCWRLGNTHYRYYVQVVVCALAVAAICPNFTHLSLDSNIRNTFMVVAESTIESGKFKQFEPLLRRLLFKK
ncbi:hypothetical protein GGI20_003952 [Coemansia sp. BCRC 34301]|nr:hypothetical protein GGI20_003952 [Coemansia sp. BCRC 34301]